MSVRPAAVANRLLDGILKHANAEAAVRGKVFFKEPVQLLGVNAAKMRGLAREVFREVKSQVNAADAVAICDRLLRDPRLEIKNTALLFLACYRKQLDRDVFGAAKGWIESNLCNSWAVIDELCGDVLGPMLQADTGYFALTRNWFRSPNMWLRRAALVVLVKPARRGILLDETYSVAGKLLNDPEDLVQKAAGWLLREAGKPDMARLQDFLQQHGTKCARTTLRYAIERCPEAIRKRLLASTRSKPI